MLEVKKLGDLHRLGEGSVTAPKGFFAGGLHCGIKRKRLDLGWLYSAVPATAAGVYTTNLFQAPPLKVTQDSLSHNKKIQGIIVNSGNANACTGEEGLLHAKGMRKWFADQIGVSQHLVAVGSTGVIGEALPIEKIQKGIEAIDDLERLNSADDFEKAILTTDTVQKKSCIQFQIDGKTVTIGGVAKGSGMIHPNMATMLAFITTDANVSNVALDQALKYCVNQTFNMITVDGDTSTNDMVLLLANGLAGNFELSPQHPDWAVFLEGLNSVCQELAILIAKDGEGATKLIEVQVSGANTERDAKNIAKAIAGSNLVKSAIFGTDPNWGRIITAAGYSGAKFSVEETSVKLGPYRVVNGGIPVEFKEEDIKSYLEENDNIVIFIELQSGKSSATAWGCDLTYDYVRINASYRT